MSDDYIRISVAHPVEGGMFYEVYVGNPASGYFQQNIPNRCEVSDFILKTQVHYSQSSAAVIAKRIADELKNNSVGEVTLNRPGSVVSTIHIDPNSGTNAEGLSGIIRGLYSSAQSEL